YADRGRGGLVVLSVSDAWLRVAARARRQRKAVRDLRLPQAPAAPGRARRRRRERVDLCLPSVGPALLRQTVRRKGLRPFHGCGGIGAGRYAIGSRAGGAFAVAPPHAGERRGAGARAAAGARFRW